MCETELALSACKRHKAFLSIFKDRWVRAAAGQSSWGSMASVLVLLEASAFSAETSQTALFEGSVELLNTLTREIVLKTCSLLSLLALCLDGKCFR